MAGYTPCAGTGKNAVELRRYDSQKDGLGRTRAKTFGQCPDCGWTVMEYGLAMSIKVNRHKARTASEDGDA